MVYLGGEVSIRNNILFILTVFFICTFTRISHAQEHMNFKYLTIENGLSQSTAAAIYQDSRGYIWIGTNEGLNRYNGFEIKVYKSDKYKKGSIVNNYILSLQEDNSNNLWVGTNKGISKINLKTDEITNFECDENGNPFYKVRSILLTERGTLIVITQKNVYLYDEKNNKFTVALHEQEIFKTEDIVDIKEDKSSNIWVGTTKSLIKVDRNTKEIIQYYSDDSGSIIKMIK